MNRPLVRNLSGAGGSLMPTGLEESTAAATATEPTTTAAHPATETAEAIHPAETAAVGTFAFEALEAGSQGR